ncbi:uncharacterized protein AB9X84_017538 [Acanthopagrus schlegelii]
MKDGCCTKCTRKCPVSDHVKEDWIYVTKTRRVTKILQDVKKKYEKEKSEFSERLLDLFRSDDGVHEINAVGLVLKATDNRLSDRLMYIFDSVVSLFGKNMEQNIVALITHSDGLMPEDALQALEDAKIKCAKDENNQLVHFLFDNCQHEDRTEETEELQHAFTKTTKGLKKFTDILEQTRRQKLKTTKDVLKSRIRLTACIQNLKQKIQLTELKQTEIQQTQEALKKHEEEMKKDEKFTVEVDEAYKEKETIRAGRWWEMEELRKDKDQMLDETFQHVVKLEQIALKVDSLSTLVHLDFLIEKMKEKRDTEKIQKLEEMKSRVDERTRAAARYRQTSVKEKM